MKYEGDGGSNGIEALLFDTFGTTVDWKDSLTAYCERFGSERGLTADWNTLVTEWQALAKPAMQTVRDRRRVWANFDELHRETLHTLLPKYGLHTLFDGEYDVLVHGWHLLAPWPDTIPGLRRLRQSYIIGTLSNGTVRQLTNMAKHSGLPWDVILGADTFNHYKTDPQLYQGAIELIGSAPETILMVAAHNNDLEAARKHGMRTAFVKRPTEDPGPTEHFDYVARDFEDLAAQLGT